MKVIPRRAFFTWQVEAILGERRARVSGGCFRDEYHVKWKGYRETTWEPRKNLTGCIVFEQYVASRTSAVDGAPVHERRFAADRARRKALGRVDIEPDPLFLAALSQGLPNCAGVALGVDRLLMLAQSADRLDEVM